MRFAIPALTLLMLPACASGLESCPDSLDDDRQLVKSLEVAEASGTRDLSGDNAQLILKVTANVPCIEGGMRVHVATNAGRVGESGPGKLELVHLSPTAEKDELSGYVSLVVPYKLDIRVFATAPDAEDSLEIGTLTREEQSDAGAASE